jgi:hypothetical protein
MTKNSYGPVVKNEDSELYERAFLGWTVIGMGFTETYKSASGWEGRIEGGLTFVLKKGRKKKRVIFGYTELGEWIEAEEDLS